MTMPENEYWNACRKSDDDKIELLHVIYHDFADDCQGCVRSKMVMPDAR
jgi:hypothetical protein